MACLGIRATLSIIDDELIRHQLHSQSAEELMHFMEGKYQPMPTRSAPRIKSPSKKFSIFCCGLCAGTELRFRGRSDDHHESSNCRESLHRLRPVSKSALSGQSIQRCKTFIICTK
jgi:hypothetical protein